MKKIIYLLVFAFIASTAFVACDDDASSSPFKTVILGAQDNNVIGGFYSINNEKVYTMEQAASNQETIDLLCFYENNDSHQNNTTLSSPGANITGIFSGDNSPENWETTDTTYFYHLEPTVFTTAQFDALTENDVVIQTLFSADDAKRKAKDLQVDDIYAFKTQDNYYGLFKVVSVVTGETGSVEIKYILKK